MTGNVSKSKGGSHVVIDTDTTLSVAGKAADAKAAGDALHLVEDEMFSYTPKAVESNKNNRYMNDNGLYSSNSTYLVKQYQVTAGAVYKVVSDVKFQFQADNTFPTTGTPTRVGTTYGAGTFLVKAPTNSTYLMVCTFTSGGSVAVYSSNNLIIERLDEIEAEAEIQEQVKINTALSRGSMQSTMRSGSVTYYHVGPSRTYTTINAALTAWETASKPPAVVYVDNGEYDEVVYVEDSTISFIGESREGTILRTTSGDYEDAPFRIHHGNVYIANFTVIADHSDTPSMVLDTNTLYGYAFHIDGGSVGGLVHVYNCTAISYQAPAFGMGTIPGSKIRIENTDAYCYTPGTAGKTTNNDCILCHLADPSLYQSEDPESLELINVNAYTAETPFVLLLKANQSTKKLNLTAINTALVNAGTPAGLLSGGSVATIGALSIGNNVSSLNYSAT